MKMIFRILLMFMLCLVASGSLSPVFAKEQFVAVVITGDLARYREAHEAFLKVLRTGGMTEDKVKIYVQTPSPDPMSWINSIRKAVGVGADIIVTYGAPAALAAKKEARNTPVLFADVYDPVGLGIVKDLAVPGGDITGVSGKTPLETLLKAFAEIQLPKTMGVLYSSDDKGSELQLKQLESVSKSHGITLVKKDIKRTEEISAAVDAIASHASSLFLTESALLCMRLNEIMTQANQKKLPVLSQVPGLSDMGALMTLEADPTEQGQLVAVYTLQILAGKKAHTLPIFTPKKVSLVVNMKTADKLALKVPFQTLSLATRVIK